MWGETARQGTGLRGKASAPRGWEVRQRCRRVLDGEPGVTGRTRLRINSHSEPCSPGHRGTRDPAAVPSPPGIGRARGSPPTPAFDREDSVVCDTCHQGHPTGMQSQAARCPHAAAPRTGPALRDLPHSGSQGSPTSETHDAGPLS